LRECNFDTTPDGLMTYIGSAMQAREYAKLIFTRSVSDALETIAAWGREMGLSRDDLSYIDIRCILGAANIKQARPLRGRMLSVAEKGRRRHEVAMALHLPHLIRNETDAAIVPLLLSQPNFITQKTIRAPIAVLSDVDLQVQDLEGRVVVVENADPGYDWIFARAIAGLITMFGGANSHMAIRCAEFGLPAAIGCGEQLFERVASRKAVEINCAEKRVTPLEH
jgi:phosphohistidine swiveling domain-containing protein